MEPKRLYAKSTKTAETILNPSQVPHSEAVPTDWGLSILEFKMSIFDKYDLTEVDESFPIPEMPFGIVVVVGSSGSGKSTILKKWGMDCDQGFCNETPIYKMFDSEENAEKYLISCGLRTVPAWKRTLSQLSNGERHRAEIAISIARGNRFIDEFTSVVDRDTAMSLSVSMSKIGVENLVIATCHRDVLQWIEFDHCYDTDAKKWIDRGLVRRQKSIGIRIEQRKIADVWEIFRRHHYLSSKANKSARCYVAILNNKIVAMTSVLAYPSGTVKNAWREHRAVVLPEFQGLGIGSKLSDFIAQVYINEGGRFFSKTSHPAFGEYRNKSALWKPTSKNGKARKDYSADRKTKEDGHKMMHAHRICYSHEYIGNIGG